MHSFGSYPDSLGGKYDAGVTVILQGGYETVSG